MNDIDALAKKMGINLSEKRIRHSAIKKGASDEWKEHGVGKFKVLNSKQDAIKTALAHLVKDPNYYSK